MENIITELETTFEQPVNERPWTSNGLTFGRYINEVPDYQTKQFKTTYGVALWFDNEIVVTISRVKQWNAFKSVACLFSQVRTGPNEQELQILKDVFPENFTIDN